MRPIRIVGALVAIVLALSACSDCGDDEQDPGAPSAGFGAPQGTRWVGVRDIVIAVPDAWRTTTSACPRAQKGVVFETPESASMRCLADARTSSLVFARSVRSLWPGCGRCMDLPYRTNGLVVTTTGRCRAGGTLCSRFLYVRSTGLAALVTIVGRDARTRVDEIVESVRRLPDGFSTVPFVEYGESISVAEQRIEQAGLVPERASSDGPSYATGTRPAPGTVVASGTRVTITLGEG